MAPFSFLSADDEAWLQRLIGLCRDVAEGWPVSSGQLEELTPVRRVAQGDNTETPPQMPAAVFTSLGEAVGVMLLRVEDRQRASRIRMRELEHEHDRLRERNRCLAAAVQDLYQPRSVVGHSPLSGRLCGLLSPWPLAR